MKRRINKPQSILALATLLAWAALCLTACINQGFDPDDNSPHAHLTLLQLGNVTIADAQTAPAGTTRAATAEDPATGFTGIRKTTFVAGDKLTLSIFAGNTTAGNVTEATFNGSTWEMPRTFTAAGSEIIASYTPVSSMMHDDRLVSDRIPLPVDGSETTFTMKHINAMIEVTPPAGKTVADVVVKATFYGREQNLPTAAEVTTVSGKDATIYRTIADPGSDRDPGTVTAITLTIDGNAYTATLATALTVEGNKRYPIALSMKENELIATVGTASLGWGAGTDMNLTYTRTIGTPEDLAQFAYEVNNNLNNAPSAVVMQTADIDLSQLKTPFDANQELGTNKYTYTATAEQWVPIGLADNVNDNEIFTGKYNGGGYTITGLKMTKPSTSYLGLFGDVKGASFTGIHIRDCSLADGNATAYAGALIAYAKDVTVALCSATGTITMTNTNTNTTAGGLIGHVASPGNGSFNNITRCSSAVKVTGPCNQKVAGFVGYTAATSFVSCTLSGSVAYNNTTLSDAGAAFCNGTTTNNYYYCAATGTVSGSSTVSAFGGAHTVVGCYATGNYNTFATLSGTGEFKDNALTGTLTTGITGVTASVPESEVYGKLIASSQYFTPLQIKTLHWDATNGYTLTLVNKEWGATEAWKDNTSALPTLNLAYEGG